MKKRLRYIYGWLFVRPRRWLFHRMVWATSPRWLPRKGYSGWEWPNIHWWILYLTVFQFFHWLEDRAWHPFCTWKDRRLEHKSLIARIIHRIGQTTAGERIHGMECYHCGSPDGCQVDLADDDTGMTFILDRRWTVGTQDGTDHRFCGTTICPRCGYREYYEDGSL